MLLDKKKTFLHRLYNKLQSIDRNNKLENNQIDIIHNIIHYFNQDTIFKTMQHIIRMDILFRGFTMIDQKGNDKTRRYCESNKIIVNECTKFYFEYWILRNKLYHSKEKQLYILKRQSKKSREYIIQLGDNMKAYIEVHLIKDNVKIEYRRE